MSRAYRLLVLGVVVAAALLAVLARLPYRAPRAIAAAPAPAPVAALDFEVSHAAIEPAEAMVPKGARVTVTLVNRDAAPLSVRLAGYEDRVNVAALAPGARWSVTFDADLPGEGFAWLVGNEPVGRLAVTGSHLVEGHR